MVKRIRQAATERDSPNTQNTPSTSRGGRRQAAHSSSDTQNNNHEMPKLQPMINSPNKRNQGRRGKSKSKSPSPQASPKKGKALGRGRQKRVVAVISSTEEDSD